MDGGELAHRLAEVVGAALGDSVVIEELARLPGGASKNTWSFSARDRNGRTERLILRTDRAGYGASTMALEAALLSAASRAGVPVPRVVVTGSDSDGLGSSFLITDFVEGETIARRILRDEHLRHARSVMTGQCGRILAAIHRIPADEVPGLVGGDLPAQMRSQLDQLAQPHPAFELGLRWLAEHRPPSFGTTVVHGDFRNGNLIVDENGVRAVLDWELAHLGDPVEDLGWLCVRAWRFGSPLPVGGFGTVEELLNAYEDASGVRVDGTALRWWIAYGTLRWGIICIAQALTHLSGAVRSVELAAIGRRVCEVESDLLELLPWGGAPTEASDIAGAELAGPHDVPSAEQLLDAVREYLESDVMSSTEGRVRFHARVAANVVAMVGRELALGPRQAMNHRRRLEALGLSSEAELAEAIRSGALDDRLDAVCDAVRATVADKLGVANPAYANPSS